MKFYCDSCNTKYGIADDKVRGRVLKVRCKKCGNVITVREQSVPVDQVSAQTTLPPKAQSAPSIDPRRVPWHYSINGQSDGPFPFDVLVKRFASGELGDECYVWTDSFQDWMPVREVEFFKGALEKGQRIKPRQNTVGVSQALEAVKPEELRQREKQGEPAQPEPAQPEAAQPEPAQPEAAQPEAAQPEAAQPEPSKTDASKTDASKTDKGRTDRLAKLRARLKSSSADSVDDSSLVADGGEPQSPESPEDAGPQFGDATVQMQDGEFGDPTEMMREEEFAQTADAHGPTLAMDDGSLEAEKEDSDDHNGLFSSFETRDPSRESLEDGPAPEDSDRIPFLGDAPELRSKSATVGKKKREDEGITGSLLIQLDNIQKQGRGKKTLLIAVAVLIIGGLVATALYLADQIEPQEPVAQKKSVSDDDGELVQRTYSADERNKILVLGSQRVGAGEGDEQADDQNADDAKPTRLASSHGASRQGASKQGASKRGTGGSKKRIRGPTLGDNSAAMDEAFDSATKKGARQDGIRKTIDDGAISNTKFDSPMAGKSDAFQGLSALDSTRTDPIYNPTDSVEKRKKSTAGATKLTRKQINVGMTKVRRSIGVCRQRHSRRGAPLDARKIYLTITVEPTGRISDIELDPKRIRHTEFDKCMNSHRGRWKFATFDGDAQKMRAPFVLE